MLKEINEILGCFGLEDGFQFYPVFSVLKHWIKSEPACLVAAPVAAGAKPAMQIRMHRYRKNITD